MGTKVTCTVIIWLILHQNSVEKKSIVSYYTEHYLMLYYALKWWHLRYPHAETYSYTQAGHMRLSSQAAPALSENQIIMKTIAFCNHFHTSPLLLNVGVILYLTTHIFDSYNIHFMLLIRQQDRNCCGIES